MRYISVLPMIVMAYHASASVVISEFMYNPIGGETNEFVEVFNTGSAPETLSGWQLKNGIAYTFPTPTVLPAGAYAVIAVNQAAFTARYGTISNLLAGAYSGQLSNSGETITLADAMGVTQFSVTYGDKSPWPVEADGFGSSLVLNNLEADPNQGTNWIASARYLGSPGEADTLVAHDIVINEILAHTDLPQEDAVELKNITPHAISIAGWYLSDDNLARKKYRFPEGTILPPLGYLVVYQHQLASGLVPFALSAKGEGLYLTEADANDQLRRYVDFYVYEPSKNGVSFGRYPDGTGEFMTLTAPTFGVNAPTTVEEFCTGTGARNSGPKIGPIVINEIMYHPSETNASGRMPSEFVELLNISAQAVSFYNSEEPTNTWTLTGGISYTFPTNLVLQPGAFLLVVETNDLAGFRASYAVPTNVVIFGPWTKSLGNGGDTVRVRAPNTVEEDGTIGRYVVDEVTYRDQLPWPLAADGLGGSLERTDATAYGNTASNWHASPTTATPGTTNSFYLPSGSIVISEIMAINRSTRRDADGDFSDWIELYNTSFQTVSLKGWHLTDQAANPTLWTFPDISIAPYGHLLIFASSKNKIAPNGELHTNFSLDANGEYLALFRSDLTCEAAFSPAYPALLPDVSYGYDLVGTRIVTPVCPGTPGRYLVPTNAAALPVNWTLPTFDDTLWKPAGNGVGYDTDPDYRPYFQTDLYSAMYNKQASAFVRYTFLLDDAATITSILLRLKYEDGFIAWLNGVKIASGAAPASNAWNSVATSTRTETLAVVYTDFNLDAYAYLLNTGTNVLALQALNVTTTSSDLLLASELRLSWAPTVVTRTPVMANSAGHYLVPTNAAALAADWTSTTFDDQTWSPAGNGIGYDTGTSYGSLIQSDLYAEMYGKQSSAFVRYPFVITNCTDIYAAILRVKFDDGIVAWLNGTRVATNNIPEPPLWNSNAPTSRSSSLTQTFLDFNLASSIPLLVNGTNILAFQVLNSSTTSSDLLMQSELSFSWKPPTGSLALVAGYLATPSPDSVNTAAYPEVTVAPELSAPGGVFSGTLSVTATCSQAEATLYYTRDGSTPTEQSARYTGPIEIADETELLIRAFAPGLAPSPIVSAVYRRRFLGINEVMASNVMAHPEIADFADFSDWIELYNGGTNAVDLSGYHLSDNLESPFRWRIPDGATIPAGGYLRIWADGFDSKPGLTLTRDFWPNYTFTTRAYHANFKLAAEGEQIGLFTPNGTLIDSVTFGIQQDDISFGRLPDGGSTWGYFGESTAGTTNRGPQLAQNLHRAPAVTITPVEPLFVESNTVVTLVADANVSAIRYTLDSSQPTSASLLYTNAFRITTTTVVRARAFANGLHPSPVTTRTFLIGARNPDLPIVSVVVDPLLLFDPIYGIYSNVLKGRDVPGTIQFCTTPSNTAFHAGAGFRLYSLNTFLKAQKPLTVKFSGKYGTPEIAYPLFPEKPLGTFDRFVLRNGNDDWSVAFLRDTLGQKMLMGAINNAVQGYRPCASYLNGAYYGLINIQEKMDEVYCAKNYGVPLENIDFFENDGTTGDELLDCGTADSWNALIAFISANSLADPANYAYVKSQVDIEDIVDYVAGQVFADDIAWAHNRKWWRDRNPGGKWRWCFVDLDRAFGNVNDNRLTSMASGMVVFRELLSNAEFKTYCGQRLMAHLNSSFSTNRILPIIDAEAAQIRTEIIEHAKLYASKGGIPSVATWDNNIETIRTFARQRPAIAMQHVAGYFASGQTAQVHVGLGGGNVLGNNVPLRDNATNALLSGVPITLTAVPPMGQTFAYWRISGGTVTLSSKGSTWRYKVPTNEVPNWNQAAFNDTAWASGAGQLGYGDGDETTVIGAASNLITSAYFRKTVVVNNAATINALDLQLLSDDCAIVCLNSTEILRYNMPTGLVNNTTFALTNITSTSTPNENDYIPFTVAPLTFLEGTNVIAVEIHQSSVNYTDFGFDMQATVSRSTDGVTTNTSPVLTFIPDSASPLSIIAVFTPTNENLLPATITNTLTLTAAGSPWLATGDIFVPSNTCLIAEPGVTILMPQQSSIYVQGRLALAGTPEAPIRIDANTNRNAQARLYTDPALMDATDNLGRWGGIAFNHADHPGLLSNVVIRSATLAAGDPVNMKAAISALSSDLHLYGLDIHDVNAPIFVQEGNSTILENSRIYIAVIGDGINIKRARYARVENNDFSSAGLTIDTDAVDYDGIQGGIIRNNYIHDFMGDNNDGIDIGEGTLDLLIESNRIERCFDKAISVGQASSVIARRNIIQSVDMGFGVKDAGSYAYVEQNTFRNISHAVACYEKNLGAGGGAAHITSCIVSHPLMAPFTCDSYSTLTVDYTLCDTVWMIPNEEAFSTQPFDGTWDNVTYTHCQTAEPQFLRPSRANFELQVGSAAIDRANPALALDPDGSPADCGAIAFNWNEGHAVLSEILYAPSTTNSIIPPEFIELTNPGKATLDLSGYAFSQGIDFTFPSGTALPPGKTLTLFSGTGVTTSNRFYFAGALDNMGETLTLIDSVSNEIDSVAYSFAAPWPLAASTEGRSLELLHPHLDNARPENWITSFEVNGTPERAASNPDPTTTTVPAWWLNTYAQFTPGLSLDAAARLDLDGDGKNAYEEYIAGTDPNSATDYFAILLTSGQPPNTSSMTLLSQSPSEGLTIEIPTHIAGPLYQGRQRYYTLESTASLALPEWLPITGFDNCPATGETLRYTIPFTQPTAFYRVRVELR